MVSQDAFTNDTRNALVYDRRWCGGTLPITLSSVWLLDGWISFMRINDSDPGRLGGHWRTLNQYA
jgi:hypothetical protein